MGHLPHSLLEIVKERPCLVLMLKADDAVVRIRSTQKLDTRFDASKAATAAEWICAERAAGVVTKSAAL
jgi:hypothetical protein